ncbi:MAG TPA: CHRD domain-containing protein [Thermoanaerobaculia bacterium]|nr:CHRD domain-containing protein [Thermoanaerobaculia bacterium]
MRISPARFFIVFVLLTPVAALGQTYNAALLGTNETAVCDADGTGNATIVINGTTVSYNISVANILLPPIGQHIHGPGGTPGVNAPVFVGLTGTWSGGTLSGSVTATQAQVDAINANPAEFYVNVHTSDCGAGAVRGQMVFVSAATSIPTFSGGILLLLLAVLAVAGVIALRQ